MLQGMHLSRVIQVLTRGLGTNLGANDALPRVSM